MESMFRNAVVIFVVYLFMTPALHGKSNWIDEELSIDVPESSLYIRVRGNPSQPLIIDLHGGPGVYAGIDIALMGPGLESHFLIAYLDQRGCGKSQAAPDATYLTTEQYVEDLNIVIDTLRHRYQKNRVNLMGTSWGGMYGFLYLLKYQSKVAAYASIDGKVNSTYQNQALIDYELSRAHALLQEDPDAANAKELREIQSELHRIKQSDFSKFYKAVNQMKYEFPEKLGFNAYFADTSKIISTADVLQDTALLALMKYTPDEYLQVAQKAEMVNAAFRNNHDYNTLNIEDELSRIRTPVIVIQGAQDYVVGLEHGQRIYDALSQLTAEEKTLRILPNVGHSPAIESPDTLTSLLSGFFKKHH